MLNNSVKDDNFQLFSGFVIKLTHFRAILMPNRNTSDNADYRKEIMVFMVIR